MPPPRRNEPIGIPSTSIEKHGNIWSTRLEVSLDQTGGDFAIEHLQVVVDAIAKFLEARHQEEHLHDIQSIIGRGDARIDLEVVREFPDHKAAERPLSVEHFGHGGFGDARRAAKVRLSNSLRL